MVERKRKKEKKPMTIRKRKKEKNKNKIDLKKNCMDEKEKGERASVLEKNK